MGEIPVPGSGAFSVGDAGLSRLREGQTVGAAALLSTIATTAVSIVAGAALLISVWSCVADTVSVRASCVGAAVGWAGGVSSCRGEAHDLRHLYAPFAISNFLSNLNEGRGRVARMETKTRVLAEAYQLKVNDAISEHIHSADRRAQRTISNTATAICFHRTVTVHMLWVVCVYMC